MSSNISQNTIYTLPYGIVLPELTTLAFLGIDASNEVNIEYQDRRMRPLNIVRIYDNNASLPSYTMEGGLMYHVTEGAEDYAGTQVIGLPENTSRLIIRVVSGTVAFNFGGRDKQENDDSFGGDWSWNNALSSIYTPPNQYAPLKINASYNYILEVGMGAV